MAQTVKEFLRDSYQLVSASSPTVPLQGFDTSDGLKILNRLLSAYSATGLLTTIAKKVTFSLGIGVQEVTFGSPTFIPTPTITQGRLSNLQNAWLVLDGVTYPLIDESRNTFFASYKYDPQLGLPRFVIITNEVNITRMRFYPAASQVYEVNVYGKFALPELTENDDMSILADYYIRFFQFAVGKELAVYKGRSQAWNELLESMYQDAKKDMESVSSVNLEIQTQEESYLNGAWRVRAGV